MAIKWVSFENTHILLSDGIHSGEWWPAVWVTLRQVYETRPPEWYVFAKGEYQSSHKELFSALARAEDLVSNTLPDHCS